MAFEVVPSAVVEAVGARETCSVGRLLGSLEVMLTELGKLLRLKLVYSNVKYQFNFSIDLYHRYSNM